MGSYNGRATHSSLNSRPFFSIHWVHFLLMSIFYLINICLMSTTVTEDLSICLVPHVPSYWSPLLSVDLWKKFVTALLELNPVFCSRGRGDEGVFPAFEANNDGLDMGVGWCPWNQWLRNWSALYLPQEDHYFQMTRALSKKKYQVTPGRSNLISTFL